MSESNNIHDKSLVEGLAYLKSKFFIIVLSILLFAIIAASLLYTLNLYQTNNTYVSSTFYFTKDDHNINDLRNFFYNNKDQIKKKLSNNFNNDDLDELLNIININKDIDLDKIRLKIREDIFDHISKEEIYSTRIMTRLRDGFQSLSSSYISISFQLSETKLDTQNLITFIDNLVDLYNKEVSKIPSNYEIELNKTMRKYVDVTIQNKNFDTDKVIEYLFLSKSLKRLKENYEDNAAQLMIKKLNSSFSTYVNIKYIHDSSKFENQETSFADELNKIFSISQDYLKNYNLDKFSLTDKRLALQGEDALIQSSPYKIYAKKIFNLSELIINSVILTFLFSLIILTFFLFKFALSKKK